MSQQNRSVLKSYFETGDYPSQAQFSDLIDSFINFSDNTGSDIIFGRLFLNAYGSDNGYSVLQTHGNAAFTGIATRVFIATTPTYTPTADDNLIVCPYGASCDIDLSYSVPDGQIFIFKSLNNASITLYPQTGSIDTFPNYNISNGTVCVQFDLNSNIWWIEYVSNF